MEKYQIKSFSVCDEYSFEVVKSAYEFRPDLKYHWLQKICIRILDKIGAYSLERVPKITRIDLSSMDITKKIQKLRNDILINTNRAELIIMVGPKEFNEMRTSADCNIFVSKDFHEFIFAGLKVVYNPYMDGVIVVPRRILYNEYS